LHINQSDICDTTSNILLLDVEKASVLFVFVFDLNEGILAMTLIVEISAVEALVVRVANAMA
jgi:hypothetical protein